MTIERKSLKTFSDGTKAYIIREPTTREAYEFSIRPSYLMVIDSSTGEFAGMFSYDDLFDATGNRLHNDLD